MFLEPTYVHIGRPSRSLLLLLYLVFFPEQTYCRQSNDVQVFLREEGDDRDAALVVLLLFPITHRHIWGWMMMKGAEIFFS